MSKSYTQLNLYQRYQIEALRNGGHSQKSISEVVGVSASTVCRELKRNTPKSGSNARQYSATAAQHKTDKRHRAKPKAHRFTEEMKGMCRSFLGVNKYSPELISVCGKAQLGEFVSYETIYKWIWAAKKSNRRADKADKGLYRLLRHGKRRHKRGNRRDRRGAIPYRVHIEERPKIVSKRKRLGDLEVDLMVGKNHQSAILVILDRTSRLVRLRKLPTKTACQVQRTLTAALRPHKEYLHTLTFDNDTAFTNHHLVGKALGVKTFFTRPYCSQDKGSVENRIGILRRFYPKGTDLRNVTPQELKQIENYLNHRPVRKFNYKSPLQIHNQKIALIT